MRYEPHPTETLVFVAEIVQRAQCGRVFEPENVDRLIDGLLALRASPELRQRYRDNGLAAAGHYDRREQALKMLQVLTDASAGEPVGTRTVSPSGSR